MQWVGHTHFGRLGAGVALRVYPEMMVQGATNPPLAAGDMLFVAPPNGSYLRTEVVQAADDWAIFSDSADFCWRMRERRNGEPVTDVLLVGECRDWIVEGPVHCPEDIPAPPT